VLDDDAQVLGARLARVHRPQELLGAPADDRQRAAHLVRDARRQHAHGDQLLGAHELALELAQLGAILDQREGAHAQRVVAHGHDPHSAGAAPRW
jgi:hypothetical protein